MLRSSWNTGWVHHNSTMRTLSTSLRWAKARTMNALCLWLWWLQRLRLDFKVEDLNVRASGEATTTKIFAVNFQWINAFWTWEIDSGAARSAGPESSLRSLIEVVSKDEGALVVFHVFLWSKETLHRHVIDLLLWGLELWWGAARHSCHTWWRVLWRVFSMGRLWPRGIHTISEELFAIFLVLSCGREADRTLDSG